MSFAISLILTLITISIAVISLGVAFKVYLSTRETTDFDKFWSNNKKWLKEESIKHQKKNADEIIDNIDFNYTDIDDFDIDDFDIDDIDIDDFR